MSEVKTPKHGTYSTYINWQCRCDKCRAANTAYERDRRAKRRRGLRRMGYNVTPKYKRARPEYGVADLSRAVTVRKLLPKQTGVV